MNDSSNDQLIIEVANQQALPFDETPLLDVVRTILDDHGFQHGEISIALVDDPNMKMLNRQYLNHDYETDVLSFVLESDAQAGLINGQLIVSTDTANRMAGEMGIPLDDELLLYVVHGTLHLVGLDDQSASEKSRMRKAEANYLSRYGIAHRWVEDADQEDSSWKEQT